MTTKTKSRAKSDENKLTRNQKAAAAIGIGALAIGAAAAAIAVRRDDDDRPGDSAPGRTARQRKFGEFAVVGRTVTINRPRAELFAFWRDFTNLPKFMENVEAVQPTGKDQYDWAIAGPLGKTVHVESKVIEERENELIAWRSVEGSQIEAEGRVAFRDAPGDRGTQVEAIIAYKPPGGEIGRLFAKLFQREPEIQTRRELRRFRMLMETGEIATSANRREDA